MLKTCIITTCVISIDIPMFHQEGDKLVFYDCIYYSNTTPEGDIVPCWLLTTTVNLKSLNFVKKSLVVVVPLSGVTLGSLKRYLKHFTSQTLLKIENDVSYVIHGL